MNDSSDSQGLVRRVTSSHGVRRSAVVAGPVAVGGGILLADPVIHAVGHIASAAGSSVGAGLATGVGLGGVAAGYAVTRHIENEPNAFAMSAVTGLAFAGAAMGTGAGVHELAAFGWVAGVGGVATTLTTFFSTGGKGDEATTTSVMRRIGIGSFAVGAGSAAAVVAGHLLGIHVPDVSLVDAASAGGAGAAAVAATSAAAHARRVRRTSAPQLGE